MSGYQDELRKKLEDLRSTLSLSNCIWNAWELEFIESVCDKLDRAGDINVTPKQLDKIFDLWEKL